MEMHQIRYFLAVCDCLNFTRAAEMCNVTQPALTRAVQKLEEELGGITVGGYRGPNRSPDRADAMVWAMWALIEGARRGRPRVLAL